MTLHTHTPRLDVVDPRGLEVKSIAWCCVRENDPPQQRMSRRRLNEAGRSVAEWDPRLSANALPANVTRIQSLSGRALLEDSVDAGWRVHLGGADGQVMETTDSRGSHSQTDFDGLLRPLSVTETALGGQPVAAERYGYGDASDASAQRNQCGRLIRHDDPAGTWRCDAFGLAGRAQSENRRFLQDPLPPDWPVDLPQRDQLLESGQGHTSAAAFDATASLVRQTDAAGNQQIHRFNVGGSLQQSSLQLAGVQGPRTLVSNIRYDAFDKIIEETLGNGVTGRNEYEPATGRLIRMTAQKTDGATLQDLTYDYDPVGNVVSIEDNTQAVRHFNQRRVEPLSRYVYDSLYQLIEASGREVSTGASHGPALPPLQNLQTDPNNLSPYTQHFEYDAGGNLLQLRHLGAQPFTRTMLVATDSNRSLPQDETAADLENGFDANGNLQALMRGQTLQWDLRNQLRQVTTVQREDSADDDEVYVYDGAGQRCRKIRSAKAASRTLRSEVRYLPGLEFRSEPNGEVLHVCTVQAGRSSVRLLHWAADKPEGIDNDQLRFSLNDHLGSSALELDDQGARISEEGYYPFGGTSWWAARTAVEATYKTVRYSGKERDASGLYYYGLRYYAPWLQRWINPDPAGIVDGLNVYAFVANNPITCFDRDGRITEVINTPKGKVYVREGLESWLAQRRALSPEKQHVLNTHYSYELKDSYTIISDHLDSPTPDHFVNKFTPHKWTFKENFKTVRTEPVVHANDIAAEQYLRVGRENDFLGKLPSVIKRSMVINPGVIAVAKKYESGSAELMHAFLTETQNGKSTKRILDDFGLKATRVVSDFSGLWELNIYVHVQPVEMQDDAETQAGTPPVVHRRFTVTPVTTAASTSASTAAPTSRFTVTPSRFNVTPVTTLKPRSARRRSSTSST